MAAANPTANAASRSAGPAASRRARARSKSPSGPAARSSSASGGVSSPARIDAVAAHPVRLALRELHRHHQEEPADQQVDVASQAGERRRQPGDAHGGHRHGHEDQQHLRHGAESARVRGLGGRLHACRRSRCARRKSQRAVLGGATSARVSSAGAIPSAPTATRITRRSSSRGASRRRGASMGPPGAAGGVPRRRGARGTVTVCAPDDPFVGDVSSVMGARSIRGGLDPAAGQTYTHRPPMGRSSSEQAERAGRPPRSPQRPGRRASPAGAQGRAQP